MISRLLATWDSFLGLAALIVIIILALCVLVRVVKREDVPRHLGAIVGIMILLIMLPAIIVSQWYWMTFGQHLGIAFILIAIIVLMSITRRHSRKKRS